MRFLEVPGLGGAVRNSVKIPTTWHMSGKKKSYTTGAEELVFAERNGGHRKDWNGRYGFLCCYRVFVSTTGLESVLRPGRFSKLFSYGSGSACIFLPCMCSNLDAQVASDFKSNLLAICNCSNSNHCHPVMRSLSAKNMPRKS